MRTSKAMVFGVAVGLGLVACKFECIYLYNKGHKACGWLETVVVVTGDGTELELIEEGLPPEGCACLPYELEDLVVENPDDPALDDLHEEIRAAARVRCQEMAVLAGADPAPCATAALDETQVYKTTETYDACKYLFGTIDDDKDGYCPLPDDYGGDEAGTTDGDATETDTADGRPIIPDLPVGVP